VKSVFSEDYAAFLAILVAARQKAGLTQAVVASALGRPQSYVSKFERGERRLDVIEFLALSRVLGADPHEIIRKLERRSRR
jgi:transcriptional regulator with XRE-family HTH domain